MDLEGSRSKEGGDEAAGNRQAPLPRTLATWAGLLEPYSSQKEETGLSFFFKGRDKMSWLMRSDVGADELEQAGQKPRI